MKKIFAAMFVISYAVSAHATTSSQAAEVDALKRVL